MKQLRKENVYYYGLKTLYRTPSIPFPVQNGSCSVQNGSSSVQTGNSSVQNGNSWYQNGNSSVQNGNSSVQNGKNYYKYKYKNIL